MQVHLAQCTVMFIGLNISEVAHDIQAQVSKYVSVTLGLVNSYDTWHGMFVLILYRCMCHGNYI